MRYDEVGTFQTKDDLISVTGMSDVTISPYSVSSHFIRKFLSEMVQIVRSDEVAFLPVLVSGWLIWPPFSHEPDRKERSQTHIVMNDPFAFNLIQFKIQYEIRLSQYIKNFLQQNDVPASATKNKRKQKLPYKKFFCIKKKKKHT